MADAVAFSRLVQEDERGTLAALYEARDAIAVIASRHCGRVVNTAGDSVLAEFPIS
jgi:adenylate cyclase